jgi:thiol-disulfide isomerase/thioredoxin
MQKRNSLLVLIILMALLLSWSQPGQAWTDLGSKDQPVVRVIMFWLSTCGHCEYVIKEVLPPLQDQYGDQLDILLIELVNQEDVDSLYETATIMGVAKEEVGVPFMLVGEKVLMGSDQILRELPGLI